jgi:23S rRNA pseudouridine1911/1915/1917 synthase
MKATVPADLGGERADLVVARVAEVSRAIARRMLEEGAATIDGATVLPSRRVAAGSLLEMQVPAPEPPLEAEEVPFEVLFEDAFLAVVDKPAGVVVHPGAGRRTGTLAAGLLHRWPGIEGIGDEDRWGIVHRLDRDTSGLLVVALEQRAYVRLRSALGRRVIGRHYLALVHGREVPPSGTIEAPLARDPRHPTRFRVDRLGRPARTHYRTLAVWQRAGLSLLQVTLETGRTHQIRVHAASIGHPVAGDPVYGRGGDGMPRLFLHAARIELEHPINGDRVDVRSPLPADLAGVLDGLGDPDEGSVPEE